MTTSRIKNVLVCVLALAAFAGLADTDINITSDTTLYAGDINADANYKVPAGVTLTIDIDSNVSCRCLRNDSDENPGGKVVKKGPGTPHADQEKQQQLSRILHQRRNRRGFHIPVCQRRQDRERKTGDT